jgi:hypothetical protein
MALGLTYIEHPTENYSLNGITSYGHSGDSRLGLGLGLGLGIAKKSGLV